MSNTSTPVSLANRALLSVGARAQISNLNENSTESDAINVLYVPTFEALARSAPFNCLKQQAVLTLLAAAEGTPENMDGTTLPIPPTPWLYSYAVPNDSLQIRFILPPLTNTPSTGNIPISPAYIGANTWIPGMGQIPYSVSYGVDAQDNPREIILTNQRQAQAVYTVNQPNPVIWDSLFESAFVASLAAYLVPALSLNLALMDRVVQQAEAAISIARVRDGVEGVTSMDRNASWMTARVSGGSLAYQDGYGPYAGWNNMIWPGV